jgi:beta-lactamase superfamily II metal-dependent hydrolase
MGYEVDFLAVGDGERGGDAIALRFGYLKGLFLSQQVVVIDGGYADDGKALCELIRRRYSTSVVDLLISTHPDSDHSTGLIRVCEEMEVRQLAMHLPWKHTQDMARLCADGRFTDRSISEKLRRELESSLNLAKLADRRRIPVVQPFAGMTLLDGAIRILGPSLAYYRSLLPLFRSTPDPDPELMRPLLDLFGPPLPSYLGLPLRTTETLEAEMLTNDGATSAENNSSVITLFSPDTQTRILFTADAGIDALSHAANELNTIGLNHTAITHIQVPHHGSRHNVGPAVLDRLVGPKLSVALAGKVAVCSCPKDSDKHPAKKTTNAFLRRGAPVWVTKGNPICLFRDAPARADYGASSPVPFHPQVEED